METLRNEGTDLPLSLNTTVEDILNFQKSQTQTQSLGEGCTHVGGLLFALERRPVTDDDVPRTSKPCQTQS